MSWNGLVWMWNIWSSCSWVLRIVHSSIAPSRTRWSMREGSKIFNNRNRPGQGLRPGGEVRRFPDNRLLLSRTLADQIADDHQPGGDPDARLKLGGFDIEPTDSVDGAQPRPDCPLGVVLMRLRVAEIN